MDDFISICVVVLLALGAFTVVDYVFGIITFNRSKRIYDKLNTEPYFRDEIERLRNLLNEEEEKNNELITEIRRLETEKYKLVQELNKHS